MKFEQPSEEYKSKRIEIKAKPDLKEKIKGGIRNVALAGSIGAGVVGGLAYEG